MPATGEGIMDGENLAPATKSGLCAPVSAEKCESHFRHSNGDSSDALSVDTLAIHAGFEASKCVVKGSLVTPIYMTTVYERNSQQDLLYSRLGNPNRSYLEGKVAALEGAHHGAAFSSGMAAVNAIVQACCSAGDNVVVSANMYGGAIAYFGNIAKKNGIDVTWIDVKDLAAIKSSIRPNTKLVWVEALTNPLLDMIDLEATSGVIKTASEGWESKPKLVVDNTFITPYWMNPLKLGADLVLHSASKFLNGHSDVLLGIVVCDDDELMKKLVWMQEVLGGNPSPFDCNMVFRGLKTLPLRMRAHMENGSRLAKFLETHPCVSQVFHPEATSYKYKELAKKQCRGFPGMVSFLTKGTLEEARRFLQLLKVAINATSLGGIETLVSLPNDTLAKTINAGGAVPEWAKYPSLIRVSVGLESIDDLVADFDQALRAACPDGDKQ